MGYQTFTRIESMSTPGKWYNIKRDQEGRLFCDCPSFTMSHRWKGVDIQDRECKHTKRVAELIARGWTPNDDPITNFTTSPIEMPSLGSVRAPARIPVQMTEQQLSDLLAQSLVNAVM
jgi:hypothetical protein